MNDLNMSFGARFSLAVGTFVSILRDREIAAGVRRLLDGADVPSTPATPAAPVAPTTRPTLSEATPDAAFQLLGLLQRDARFIDFVE